MRVLLAEDDATTRRVCALVLERLGHDVVAAADGLEALDAMERELYDVVLVDMHMPRLGGIGTAREISRRWPPDRRPYVLALTASAEEMNREECLRAGFDDLLGKPFTTEELKAALAGVTAR